MNPRLAPLVLVFVAACAEKPAPLPPPPPAPAPLPPPPPAPVADEPAPALRLPADTHPLAESIALRLDPRQDRFSGSVDIDVSLDHPRGVLWLHGKDMHVTEATVTPDGATPIAGTWQERSDVGLASIKLASVAPQGKARVHVVFDAPFGRGQRGLYRTSEAGEQYAYTQFESIGAREAFPCFDEPGFKIPFATSLVVPREMQAIANTHEVSRSTSADQTLVSFAPTAPLPSYLVAFAVGALDIVAAPDVPPNEARTRPLPLRGVAPKGRGKDMSYALSHTGEILSILERYVGIEYPWDKLDIVAVPGKGGAMENPGAVTFAERSLMFDPATASVGQRRGYVGVMAHELAHQWTGDLVTMAWWDDTWLNEAFATWLGTKAAQTFDPALEQDINLMRGVQGAMGADALVNARAIRQPIASTHDIENAFDTITYQKGGGVLGMFEHLVHPDVWQKGLHAYLMAHRFGNATADDFLDAENAASGQDVKTAFHTFLDKPGVPFLEVSSQCDNDRARLTVKQSRYLPVGSAGNADQTWQVPFCARVRHEVSCKLLTQAVSVVDLGTPEPALAGGGARFDVCPPPFFPNADGAGYYRFALAPKDLERVSRNLDTLTTREKIAYGSSLRAAFARAATPMKDVLESAAPLAQDPDPAVAEEPMGYVSTAREWLWSTPLRAKVERYAGHLYAPAGKRLGWQPKKGEAEETRVLRASVLGFLASTARDTSVRAEARKRGLAYLGLGKDGVAHPDALDPNLVAMAVGVVGEEADRATWDAMKALLLKSVDETLRGRLAWALGSAKDPQLAAAARELVLDPALRDSEVMTPLWAQLSNPEKRDEAWAWLQKNYDAVLARLPKHHAGVGLVGAGRGYCDESHAKEIESFFGPKIDGIEGGPRVLASTLEDVRLCAAKRAAQEQSGKAFFAKLR